MRPNGQQWTRSAHRAGALGSRSSVAGPLSWVHGSGGHRPCASRSSSLRRGFTLIELAVVFAVIAILVVVVTYAATGIRDASKVKLTRSVMSSLKMAMADFKAAGGKFPPPAWNPTSNATPAYKPSTMISGTEYRMDYYREFSSAGAAPVGEPSTGNKKEEVIWGVPAPDKQAWSSPYVSSQPLRMYGIQALYHHLSSEPNSKKVLDKMSPTSFARGSQVWPNTSDFIVFRGSPPKEVQAMVDGWGRGLYYGQDVNINNGQPYVQSAGRDGFFETDDDLYSYKGE